MAIIWKPYTPHDRQGTRTFTCVLHREWKKALQWGWFLWDWYHWYASVMTFTSRAQSFRVEIHIRAVYEIYLSRVSYEDASRHLWSLHTLLDIFVPHVSVICSEWLLDSASQNFSTVEGCCQDQKFKPCHLLFQVHNGRHGLQSWIWAMGPTWSNSRWVFFPTLFIFTHSCRQSHALVKLTGLSA